MVFTGVWERGRRVPGFGGVNVSVWEDVLKVLQMDGNDGWTPL